MWSETATHLVSALERRTIMLSTLLLHLEETALFDFLFCEVPHFLFVICFSLHRSDDILLVIALDIIVLTRRPQVILKDTVSVFVLLADQFGLLLYLLDFLIEILQRLAQETALESHRIGLVECKWVDHSHGVLTVSRWE